MRAAQILTFAVGALATVSRRQSGDLPSALTAIATATDNLNSAIEAYSSNISPVDAATQSVLAAISSAQSIANSQSQLTVDQALAASGPTTEINTAVASAISSLISKKSELEANCEGQAVYKSLQTQQSASDMLSSTIVSKLPQALQALGKNASAPAAASLQEGLTAFQNAQDTGCSSSSSMAASSSMMASSTMMAASTSAAAAMSTSAMMNMTAPAATEAPQPYTGAAVKTVASFGAVLAALIAVAAY